MKVFIKFIFIRVAYTSTL